MAPTSELVRERRRSLVAPLALRGYSSRRIEQMFMTQAMEGNTGGVTNPQTGEVWDHSTIARDITFLEKRWKQQAMAEIAEFKSRQLAELRQARHEAWRDGKLTEVRRNLALEMELMGTKASQLNWLMNIDPQTLSDELIDLLAEGRFQEFMDRYQNGAPNG